MGLVGFDGHLNTGLTLRTVRVKDGTAEVRNQGGSCWHTEVAAAAAAGSGRVAFLFRHPRTFYLSPSSCFRDRTNP